MSTQQKKGWRWGKTGKCYIPSEEGSDTAALKKAIEQGRAIKASQHQQTQENQ